MTSTSTSSLFKAVDVLHGVAELCCLYELECSRPSAMHDVDYEGPLSRPDESSGPLSVSAPASVGRDPSPSHHPIVLAQDRAARGTTLVGDGVGRIQRARTARDCLVLRSSAHAFAAHHHARLDRSRLHQATWPRLSSIMQCNNGIAYDDMHRSTKEENENEKGAATAGRGWPPFESGSHSLKRKERGQFTWW